MGSQEKVRSKRIRSTESEKDGDYEYLRKCGGFSKLALFFGINKRDKDLDEDRISLANKYDRQFSAA